MGYIKRSFNVLKHYSSAFKQERQTDRDRLRERYIDRDRERER